MNSLFVFYFAVSKLRDWLKEEQTNTDPPTLADVFEAMVNKKQQQGRYKQIADLKTAAKTLAFLQENNIMDMAGLQEKVSRIYSRHGNVGSRLNAIEKRLKVLTEHIRHSENFKNYRSSKRQYDELYSRYETARKVKGFGAERKAQKALDAANEYYETCRQQITLYEAAEKYLRDVLQERFKPNKLPPITKWTEERAAKTAEKKMLYKEYYKLKDEVKEVEIIKRKVAEIMREESRGTQRIRAQGLEL